MAHLSPLQLVQVGEAMHVIATQRDQAIEDRDHAQEQADEWERSARLSAEEAVAWRSKAQVWSDLTAAVADELEEAFRDPDKSLDTVADAVIVRLRAGRLLANGEALPSDGQLVNVVPMETVKVGEVL